MALKLAHKYHITHFSFFIFIYFYDDVHCYQTLISIINLYFDREIHLDRDLIFNTIDFLDDVCVYFSVMCDVLWMVIDVLCKTKSKINSFIQSFKQKIII